MRIFNFRDPSSPSKFSNSIMREEIHDYVRKFDDSDHWAFLVHGYNTSHSEVLSAYSVICNNIPLDTGITYAGISWPSNGKLVNYYSDLCDARDSGERLFFLCNNILKQGKVKKISLIAHSMGSYLVMNALKYFGPDMIHKIVIMGGDTAWFRYKSRKRYGKQSKKVKQLLSYYSPYDKVLSVAGKIVRPFTRIGERSMPGKAPNNYLSVNSHIKFKRGIAEAYRQSGGKEKYKEKVIHTSYKYMPDLWEHCDKFLSN